MAGAAPRPLWSVMIPHHNCDRLLGQALESVLSQAPGADRMQIEVVDDGSTAGDPEAVVREVGRGRVGFHRKPRNEGSFRTFNTCIARSRGHLVHILHADDRVLPGFYQTIEELAERHRGCALLATRCLVVDADGVPTDLTPRVLALETPSRATADFHFGCPVQCAGVVVRRDFYEAHGGFVEDLVQAGDWEMWWRAVRSGGGVVSPEVLACYRSWPGNSSARWALTGQNLLAWERLLEAAARQETGFPLREARRRLVRLAAAQETGFLDRGDVEAARASRDFWRSRAGPLLRARCELSRARWLLRRRRARPTATAGRRRDFQAAM